VGNLSLRRRRIEMLNAKRKSLPDLKDKNPDNVRLETNNQRFGILKKGWG